MSTGAESGSGGSTSASGVTYLGSRISLISRAAIRYEGILYTIDANESTVALSKVKSFGTEGRPAERQVPAREEIYEYIIFRGKDIQDLHVMGPPATASPSQETHPYPQDPAIVEMQTSASPAGLSQHSQPITRTSQFSHGPSLHFGEHQQQHHHQLPPFRQPPPIPFPPWNPGLGKKPERCIGWCQ